MNPVRKKRLIIVLAILLGVSATVGIGLMALQQNINLFYSPAQIAQGEAPTDMRIRAGGLVKEGSVRILNSEQANIEDKTIVTRQFVITDGFQDVTVEFTGFLPDLFREGQGIVAQGKLNAARVLIADEVLAKHDENYMPPEVTKALEEAGVLNHYQDGQSATDKDQN